MKIKLALAAHNTEKFYKAKEGLAGIWKVTSEPYSDDSKIWDDGEYPSRVKIEPIVLLEPHQYISPKTMVDDLEMIKYPQYWGMYFRENLKEISQKDYELI